MKDKQASGKNNPLSKTNEIHNLPLPLSSFFLRKLPSYSVLYNPLSADI